MNQSIIRVTPDQLGYKDRGIVKWFGMMLSDHSDALKKEEMNNQSIEVEEKEEMTKEDISTVLHKVFAANIPILLQANVLKNGNYYKDLECKVAGYFENLICFVLKDGRSTICSLEQIRNVEFMNSLEWYDKRK